MSVLSSLRRLGTGWYVSLLAFAVVGTLVGYFVFFEIFPGKPKIGIIDLPIDVITEEPGFTISAFLDFARRDDDIKAVVIRISSRGSSGAIAGRLLLEVRKLRMEQLKENFYQMVVAERGNKLQIIREELLEGRIYNGSEAVRLGLVDALGGDTEAIEKAASLAGISSYDVVDVNVEAFRIFNEKFARIIEPLLRTEVARLDLREVRTMIEVSGGTDEVSESLGGMTNLDMIRRLYLPSGLGDLENDLLEDLGLDISELLSNVWRLLLVPLFALAFFLGAYFIYRGSYDAPSTPKIAFEQIEMPSSSFSEFSESPAVREGFLVVDGAHHNSFVQAEITSRSRG